MYTVKGVVMQSHARLVIIGAGIVGCSVAYHLARLGWRDLVVLDQGPLFATGGSTSHAPGLVFQTNTSRMMCQLAQDTVALYRELGTADEPGFLGVGSMEVATSRERWDDLHRRVGYARSWGLPAALIGPSEARRLLPLLDETQLLGAYVVPTDGIAKAVRLCGALAEYAQVRGAATFHGDTQVTGLRVVDGRIRAVETSSGTIEAEQVLIAAGIWGPILGAMATIPIPLTPVQHQYVRTTPLAELANATREVSHPILRHQDRAMYFRQHGDCYGIGSYQHAPLLTPPEQIGKPSREQPMPSAQPFTAEDFAQPWQDAHTLLPALRRGQIAHAFNGLFSFTPDGMPLLGESMVRGLWVAEAVWVTHGGGVGRAIAEWMESGCPQLDLHEADLHRFAPHAVSTPYVRARGAQQYDEVYDILHPLQPLEHPRPLRVSPFYARQQELGAVFFEARGWERPHWYKANQTLLEEYRATRSFPERGDWAARHWSPIALAEHLATRERVALYDMTPLTRVEVRGPGALALLERLTTSRIDRPVGSVIYTALCTVHGGILSDITITRRAADHFQLGCNGPSDVVWLERHADAATSVREITGGTCCVGVWGPHARDLLQSLTTTDCSNTAFPYLTAQAMFVGEVPVLAQRISYVGELGWEIYTSADYGLRLWDTLWQAGKRYGIVAGGRAAFDALRIEKGYRLWGSDMSGEHTPYEAGLGFVVKRDKTGFIGQEALEQARSRGPSRKLCCLVLDDPAAVMLGKEPLLDGDQVLGYVTSAAYGPSVGASIVYGWLPSEYAGVDTRVDVEYFGQRFGATVRQEPLFDPQGDRLRA